MNIHDDEELAGREKTKPAVINEGDFPGLVLAPKV
jgi:hypothetical protein